MRNGHSARLRRILTVCGWGVLLLAGCDKRARGRPEPSTTPSRNRPDQVRPTVVVTHPTGAFVRNLIFLQEQGLLPRLHLILVVHERQRQKLGKVRAALRRAGRSTFEVVRLAGLPRPAPSASQWAVYARLDPLRGKQRTRISGEPFRPKAWRHTFASLLQRSDALFVPGGSNIPAGFYGAKQFLHGISRTPVRSLYELSMLSYLLGGPKPPLAKKPQYVILGICYGLQALNVALGGTLYQSIPLEIYQQKYVSDILRAGPGLMHRNYFLALYPTPVRSYRGWFHPLVIREGTDYFTKLERVHLLSNHEQAVRKLGRDLRIVATSTDGRVVEAVQHARYPNVIGIQGHLERRFAWQRLNRFSDTTRRFHRQFFRQLSQALRQNHARRVAGVVPTPNP